MIQNLNSSCADGLIPLLVDLGYPDQDVSRLTRRIQTFLSSDKSFIYGFFEDEILLGFGSLCMIPLIHEDGYLGRISALAVRQYAQGRGIGKRLVSHMESIAISYDCHRMELTSGAHRESKAHEFYLSVGYEKYAGARFIKRLNG